MEEKAIAKITYEAKDGQQVTLSFETIAKYLVQGHSEYVTRQEMMYFMGICKSRGLNPFAKDCYLIKYSQKDGAAIITSIDYFRKRAKAQRDCKGWRKGIIVERKGEIVYSDGLMLDDDILLGGWFKAKPEGWEEPFVLEVNLKGYIKKTKDGAITKFWQKENQPTQIAKVAESQGLRTLWPDEFQQLYTQEELGEANTFKAVGNIISKDAATELNEKIKASVDKPTKEDIYKPRTEAEPQKSQTTSTLSAQEQEIYNSFIHIRKQATLKATAEILKKGMPSWSPQLKKEWEDKWLRIMREPYKWDLGSEKPPTTESLREDEEVAESEEEQPGAFRKGSLPWADRVDNFVKIMQAYEEKLGQDVYANILLAHEVDPLQLKDMTEGKAMKLYADMEKAYQDTLETEGE